MRLDKIGFIGLGLIGGSIAKKIKQLYPDTALIASAGSEETIKLAYLQGLITNDHMPDLSDFSDCGLIFLCAPVQKNLDYLRALDPVLPDETYITDVGSTKGEIHALAESLGRKSTFIGGHPMTGSEKTGLKNADPGILVNAYYIITPSSGTPEAELAQFEELVRALGSIPLVMEPEFHDHATAAISHLPHMIAFSLVNLIKDKDNKQETLKTIAAGGFKDITRIASSSPVMWQSICRSNRDQLLSLMDDYLDLFSRLRGLIAAGDDEALLSFFSSARDYRDSIAIPAPSRRDLFDEIYLDVNDNPGEIAIIASILGAKGISIRNIGIINNREFEEGVLRIEFYNKASVKEARMLLEAKGYHLY